MPCYEFEDVKTGERIELWEPMSQAVPIGKVVQRAGRRVRRVAAPLQINGRYDGHFRNLQINKHHPIAKGADAHDEKGRPVWTSRERAREAAARAKGSGLDIEFDG